MHRICLIGPKPPPVYGVSLLVQYLLDLTPKDKVAYHHINAVFADDISKMTSFSVRKVLLLAKFCLQLIKATLTGKAQTVVLIPACYLGPFLKDSVFIWLSTLILRRRTIGWIHMDWKNMHYDSRPAILRWYIRLTLNRLNHILLLGSALQPAYPKEIPAEKFLIMPTGVPDPQQQPGFAKADTPTATRDVLFISNIIDAKGWKDFLTAARQLAPEFPDARFLLYGAPHGHPAEVIHAEIARDNPTQQISYGGPISGEAKWTAFATASIYCMPSHHEAFPLVILEAMGSGLPIVSTRVGAAAEAVPENEGGLIVPPQSPESLTAALRQLLRDPALCQAYAKANRERYEQKFTLSAFIHRWTTLFS